MPEKPVDEECRSRIRRQAAVADLALRALKGVELDALFAETTAVIAHLLGVEFSGVLELLPDGGSLILRAGSGWREGRVGRTAISASPRSLAGFAIRTAEPIRIEDLATEVRFDRPALFVDHAVASGICVLVRSEELPFGLLGAFSAEAGSFDREDETLLATIADALGSALDRKRCEDRLRRANARMEEAQSVAGIGHWEWDIPANVVRWSAETHALLGWEPGSVPSTYQDFLERVHPEDRETVDQAMSRAYSSRETFECEHRVARAGGEVRWFQPRGRVVVGDNGQPVRMVGTIRDVTERKRVEIELQSQADELQSLRDELELRVRVRTADLEERIANIEGAEAAGDARDRETGLAAVREIRDALARIETTAKDLARQAAERLQPSDRESLDSIAGTARRLAESIEEVPAPVRQ